MLNFKFFGIKKKLKKIFKIHFGIGYSTFLSLYFLRYIVNCVCNLAECVALTSALFRVYAKCIWLDEPSARASKCILHIMEWYKADRVRHSSDLILPHFKLTPHIHDMILHVLIILYVR